MLQPAALWGRPEVEGHSAAGRGIGGSEIHTEGSAMLKPREAKVVWTRGTDNRLVLEELRERAGMWWR